MQSARMGNVVSAHGRVNDSIPGRPAPLRYTLFRTGFQPLGGSVIEAGGQAPENVRVFVRPGEAKTLRELRGDGPAVLLFFPLAFSGVCTKEMCSIAEDFTPWADLGANVIAISVDSPFTNAKFAESMNATFPIVSDFNREAMEAFDVERANVMGLRGVSERAAFVIDRGGIIRYAWVGEDPDIATPMDEVRAAVERLK